MKKILFIFFIIIVAIAVSVHSYLDIIIKRGIETYSTQTLGVEVSLNSVSVSLTKGAITLRGLHINNPQGFSANKIFSAESIKINLDLQSIFSPVINISNILIEEPSILYEFNPSGDNLSALRRQINRHSPAENERYSHNTTKEAKRLRIHMFEMRNSKLIAEVQNVGQKSLNIPDIRIKDIGVGENGTTVSNFAEQILRELIKVIAEVNVKELFNNLKDITSQIKENPKDAGKIIIDQFFK